MKRWMIWGLAAVMLLTSMGCGAQNPQETVMENPVELYYCISETRYYSGTGALGREVRDLGAEINTDEEFFALYFAGPQQEYFASPFPAELCVEQLQLENGTLTLNLNKTFGRLNGVQRTLAAACLVYTLTQFEEVEQVILQCAEVNNRDLLYEPLTREDFLLLDDSDTSDQVTVKLYFASASGRYLVEESRSRSFDTEAAIPAYIIQQLIAGPREDALPVIPEGTSLLDIRVSDGTCTVDFSKAFVERVPKSHEAARLTVFSVVNSLTELPEIECVRFLCDGTQVKDYAALDLSEPLYREEPVLGQTRAASNYYDATLYLPCGMDSRLASVPTYVRRSTGRSLQVDVLNALLSFDAANGYQNPIPPDTMVVDLRMEDGLCELMLNSAFASCDADPEQAELAVRAIVATLCSLNDVKHVQISVHNSSMTSVDLSQIFTVQEQWLMP